VRINDSILFSAFELSDNSCTNEAAVTDLFSDYNKIIPPREDGGGTLEVQIEMFPKYIKEFDEVSESFVYIAGLLMLWKDYRFAWDQLRRHRYSYGARDSGMDTRDIPSLSSY